MATDTTIAELQAQIEEQKALVERLLTSQVSSSGISADQLKDILASVQHQGAEGMRRAMKPENATSPLVSAFSHPEGERDHPKEPFYWLDDEGQKVPRDVYDCGARLDHDLLTPGEVDLLNQIQKDADSADGKYLARIKDRGRRLEISMPTASFDELHDTPSMSIRCRLMLNQPIKDQESLVQEVERLKAELAAEKARRRTKPGLPELQAQFT